MAATLSRVEAALAIAWYRFQRYEQYADLADPNRSVFRRKGLGYSTNDLYASYIIAKDDAVGLAREYGVPRLLKEAESLP